MIIYLGEAWDPSEPFNPESGPEGWVCSEYPEFAVPREEYLKWRAEQESEDSDKVD